MVEKKPANYDRGRAKRISTKLTKPSLGIRNRLRRGKNREEDIALYAEHSHYFKPVHDWDMEELAHGRPRGKTGGFQGRAPGWLTADIIPGGPETSSRPQKRAPLARTWSSQLSAQ